MTIRDIRNLPSNLDKQISRDFNNLIRKIHRTLSTKKHSPVYTGFFASSWNSIKKQATAEFLKNKFANKANKSTGYYNVKPFIKPRFPVDRAFNYTRTVYIGNQAKYAAYALEGGKLQLFIQGSLGKMIKETMTDKGKIFIGGSTTFNNSPRSTTTQPDPTVKYTEF